MEKQTLKQFQLVCINNNCYKLVDFYFFIIIAGVRLNLPPYARPVFLRILKEVQLTGTFKLKKLDLQLEGYDVTKIIDPIFLLRSDGFYRKLTMEEFLNIQKCILRI